MHVVSVCDFHSLVCVVTIESLICFLKKVTGMSSTEIPQQALVLVNLSSIPTALCAGISSLYQKDTRCLVLL